MFIKEKMKVFFSTVLFVIYFNHVVTAFEPSDDYKLELVQVLFRHGDRVPDKAEVYETDPYDKIYESYGYGQLTKLGEQREHKIGQVLKERYGDFLGDFKNSDVYAYSTDVDRTKMSLQLALAGLYPPSSKTSWSNNINWLPIPTHYDPVESNFLAGFSCPMYRKLFEQAAYSPEVQQKVEKYQDFYKSLEKKTGVTSFTPFGVYLIYCNIHAAESLGLRRPDWCTEEDFKKIEEISAIAMQTLTHSESMKRTMGGLIVEKFLENANKEVNEDSKKIYLYAAHDLNVASFTNIHNFTGIPDIPDYGSTIIFEKLRGKDDRVYVRMYLWTGVTEKLIALKLDKCEETCLLSDYTKIVQPILPDTFARQCTSRSNLCRRRSSFARKTDESLQLSSLFAGRDLTSFKYMKDLFIPSIHNNLYIIKYS